MRDPRKAPGLPASVELNYAACPVRFFLACAAFACNDA